MMLAWARVPDIADDLPQPPISPKDSIHLC